MQSLGKLVAYLAITGTIVIGLASAASFLLRSDGAPQQAKAAPVVPQKIADSIERKRAPVPQFQPDAPSSAVPVQPTPIMREANVALTPAQSHQNRIREIGPPKKKKRQKKIEQAPAESPSAAPRDVVTTARTDVPY